jgi:predicted DNA-binding protein YlxM (UPF0122 family)
MLPMDSNEAKWTYALQWIDGHTALLKSLYRRYGWSTEYSYDDFTQQVMLLASELYDTLAGEGRLDETSYYNALVWKIRSDCWGNRTIKRVKDVDKKRSDDESRVETVDFSKIADFYGGDSPDISDTKDRLSNYNIIINLLSYLTVKEADYLTMYLGIGDAPVSNMEEIAAKHNITISAVSQSIASAKSKLYKILAQAGISKDTGKDEMAAAMSKLFCYDGRLKYEYIADKMSYMDVERIKVAEPFRSICTPSEQLIYSIASNIKAHGYDATQPLIVWKEEGILIDGHTRLEAVKLAEYDKPIPVVKISLPSTKAAVDYALNLNYNRRNVRESDILAASERIFGIFHDIKGEREKTMLLARVCADLPMVKVKKIVALMESADEKEMNRIKQESVTINEMYKNLKARRFTARK